MSISGVRWANAGSATLSAYVEVRPHTCYIRYRPMSILEATARADTIRYDTGNESVPIQLAQCWFPGLAISKAEI